MDPTPTRPNLLLITSDQHRADTLGVAGHPCVETPHLDLLAYQGTRFTNCFADCPVCVPARTTLVTGRRAHENGQPEYAGSWRLERDRRDWLGSLLTAAGYQTELVGKTHWHTEPDFRAGFEHVTWLAEHKRQQLAETGRAGTQVGLGYNEMHPTASVHPPHLHSTNWCVERAMSFLETRERAQPFALWVSLLDPHPPLTAYEPYFSMYQGAEHPVPKPVLGDWLGTDAEPLTHWIDRHAANKGPLRPAELRRIRAVYAGMVTHMDHQLGRLIAQLQALGDWNDTLVVYSSDHGEFLGDHGAVGKRSFLGASGRVPLIVRPPDAWGCGRGRVNHRLVEWADLLPTLTDAAGARTPADVTGRSLLPHVRGEEVAEHVMHGQIGGSHMLCDGAVKYLYDTRDGSELAFDLVADPEDVHPLGAEANTAMRSRLVDHLAEEGHEHLADGGLLDRHEKRPSVETLRARDMLGLAPAEHLNQIGRDVLPIH